jgi:hypothetical protein
MSMPTHNPRPWPARLFFLLIATGAALRPAAGLPQTQGGAKYPKYAIERLGLVGPEQTSSKGGQKSEALFFNAPHFVAGTSERFGEEELPYSGLDAWAWDGKTTKQIGLTGTGYTCAKGYQVSKPLFQNNAGLVAGVSNRLSVEGRYIGSDAWVWDGSKTVQIGLTGADYKSKSGSTRSEPQMLNAAGQVVGYSYLITGGDRWMGPITWVWDGKKTTEIGLVPQRSASNPLTRNSSALFQNAAGQVVGTSNDFDGTNSNGQFAWVWSGKTTQIGLTGPGSASGSGYNRTDPLMQNDAGQVVGTSMRSSRAGQNGQDTWVWDGKTTKQIGLTGTAYTGSSGYQFSKPILQSAAGQVLGISTRLIGLKTENGQDCWIFDGTTTRQIGLTGAVYTGSAGYQQSEAKLQNNTGQVAGTSMRITRVKTINGTDAWVWNGKSATQIGLTGPGYTGSTGLQSSEPLLQNAAGHVAGTSSRITGVDTRNGFDAWVWDGTKTIPIGLTLSAFGGQARSVENHPLYLNPAGQVVGYSRCTNGDSIKDVTKAWVWDGKTTTEIDLKGSPHTPREGYLYNFGKHQNAAGQVSGQSEQITSKYTLINQVAWYFDPATRLSTPIVASVRTSDNLCKSAPTLLTDDGFLLGVYSFYAAGLGDGEDRAFIFRPDLGLSDLGDLAGVGITPSPWRTLSKPLFSDGARNIVGHGSITGQTPSSQSVFAMRPNPAATATPNPNTGPVLD